MKRFAAMLAVLLVPLSGGPVRGAGYDSLVEQGLFYLGRGATYGPEAVRSLEQARSQDLERAASDPVLLGALARAYAVMARYTEAFWLLQGLEGLGRLGAEEQALRDRLLGESGLGRVRLVSAVPLAGLRVRLEPAEGARFDVSSRKALERLGELLERGVRPGPSGLALLAPEGRYRLACDGGALFAPREPVALEVWAGDEVEVRLVPLFPEPSRWTVDPHSRSVALSWPPVEGASYRLFRRLGEGEELVYEGAKPAHDDRQLPVGVRVSYRLEATGPGGEVLAASGVEAATLPPVSEVRAEASLEDDLRVQVRWELGSGAADRVRVVREGPEGDVPVLEQGPAGPVQEGAAPDGPFLPEARPRVLRYRVEAWIEGDVEPAASVACEVTLPPLVERVVEVAESIDRGAVVVVWDTLPRDAAAEGYAIFRQRGQGVEGELVARLSEPFAREFEYAVEDPLSASSWRHFVVPFVGSRYLLDPERLRIGAVVPEESMDRRYRRGDGLPDLCLSWDPYPGAAMYAVLIGDREVLVKKPYVEADGLQNPLLGTTTRVEVFALDPQGERVPLLELDLGHRHYPRGKGGGGQP